MGMLNVSAVHLKYVPICIIFVPSQEYLLLKVIHKAYSALFF
jgi:hypothetical protein